MTLANSVSADRYTGTGLVSIYPYTFKIFDETHVRVVQYDSTAGTESDLVLNTDYTVDGVEEDTGGNVTLGTALPSGDKLTILRDMPFTQETDLRSQGQFRAESHENEFDSEVMMIQQLEEKVGRQLTLPASEEGTEIATTLPLAADRADMVFAFDSLGNPTVIANVPTSPAVTLASFFVTWLASTVSATIQNFLQAATGPTALAALGVSAFMQDFLTKTTAALARTKLAFGTAAKFIVQGDMGLLSVGTPELINSSVTGDKIAAATITGDKFFALNLGIERGLTIAKGVLATQVDIAATAMGVEEYLVTTVAASLLTSNQNTPDGTDGTNNGSGVGVITNSTWYALWLIYNPTTDDHALVCTPVLTATGPNLAGANFAGYTKKRHVGFFYNNSAGAVDNFRQLGRGLYHMKDPEATLSAATPASFNAWQAVTFNAATSPPIEMDVFVTGSLRTSTDTLKEASVSMRPTNSVWQSTVLAGGSSGGAMMGCTGGAKASGSLAAGNCTVRQTSGRAAAYYFATDDGTGTSLTLVVVGFKVPQL